MAKKSRYTVITLFTFGVGISVFAALLSDNRSFRIFALFGAALVTCAAVIDAVVARKDTQISSITTRLFSSGMVIVSILITIIGRTPVLSRVGLVCLLASLGPVLLGKKVRRTQH